MDYINDNIKKRVKKDPNEPKKLQTALDFFLKDKDYRAKIKEENPGFKSNQVNTEARKWWKELDTEIKAVYEKKSKEDKVRYETEMKVYKTKQASSETVLNISDDDNIMN